VEELRLVAGMTSEILYGEDANLNGILDANENDADSSAPNDNRDSRLDPGLVEYFTVYSREPAGGTNINIRQDVQALLDNVLGNRAAQIMSQLFPTRPPGPGGGNVTPNRTSLLQFYLNSGMTEDEFAQVADYLRATTNTFSEGLVNVNTASEPVLECIPGIGVDYASQMISYRESNPSKLATVAWVVDVIGETNALSAGPFITTHSYQYTADIAAVGHYNRGSACAMSSIRARVRRSLFGGRTSRIWAGRWARKRGRSFLLPRKRRDESDRQSRIQAVAGPPGSVSSAP
jgi:hypothetical protein